MNAKIYVTMIDRFMSGWGEAIGRNNKIVIECDDYETAYKIKRGAANMAQMKYINTAKKAPKSNSRQLVSYLKASDLGKIWFA